MSKRETLLKALDTSKTFIWQKLLNWSAAGIVRTDPITNEEADFLEHQHQVEPIQEPLEPIYITLQSKEGLYLHSHLGVLISNRPDMERASTLYNSLIERGLTRHEFYEVGAILKQFGY